MRYYMFHKPGGCITATKDLDSKTVLDYFDQEIREGLFPVGRLDKDTEGLLLLTNDGQFSHSLMYPDKHVEKTYFFWAFGSMEAVDRGSSVKCCLSIRMTYFMKKQVGN
jgi:16S rRNA pseudouridine516 synthase